MALPLYAYRNVERRRCGNCGQVHAYLTMTCRVLVHRSERQMVELCPAFARVEALPDAFAEPTIPLGATVTTPRWRRESPSPIERLFHSR